MTDASVLISSAGRRVELLRAFRAALATLGLSGEVVATDRSWYSSALHSADRCHVVPRCGDPEFIPRLLDICEAHRITLVVPTIDPELPILAAARDDFAAVGVTVAVPSPEAVSIAGDKQATHEWLVGQGFPTVRQTDPVTVRETPGDWPFPLLVKPRHGSAAKGVAMVHDSLELDVAARDADVVVQTVAQGVEHTIDVLVDRGGRCVCAVPRRRIEVRAGEVAKAVTVRSPELERLATAVCDALSGAYGAMTIQVFVDDDSGDIRIIEMNARFGGGFPLSREAGADFPRWMLEEVAGLPSTATTDAWRAGLVMLRYDAAVFLPDDGHSE